MNKPSICPIKECNPKFIKWFYYATMLSIVIMTAAFFVALLFFLAFVMMSNPLCYFGVIFPIFTHLGLLYFGKQHINNHYKLKKTRANFYFEEIQRISGATNSFVWMIIFLVGSVIRLYRDISNLIISKEYVKSNP